MDDDEKEIERILAMSEAELRAEIEAEGRDWDFEIAQAQTCFELAMADAEYER